MERITVRTGRIAFASALACLALAGLAWAQGGAEAGAPAGTDRLIEQSVSLAELFRKGGVLMYPISGMSLVALALIVYFFLVLRERYVIPPEFRKDVTAKIAAGALEDARTACAYRPCRFAEIALVALDYVQAAPDADAAVLKDLIEGEGNRQSGAMQTEIQYLLDVAVVTPMIGLLGTVFGMMRAFNVVAFDLAKAKPMLLAGGVSEALITTAAGLIVGIPAMLFYSYFRGRVSRLTSRLEGAAGEVMTGLLRKRSA